MVLINFLTGKLDKMEWKALRNTSRVRQRCLKEEFSARRLRGQGLGEDPILLVPYCLFDLVGNLRQRFPPAAAAALESFRQELSTALGNVKLSTAIAALPNRRNFFFFLEKNNNRRTSLFFRRGNKTQRHMRGLSSPRRLRVWIFDAGRPWLWSIRKEKRLRSVQSQKRQSKTRC